jgi:uncharacterized membrane protein
MQKASRVRTLPAAMLAAIDTDQILDDFSNFVQDNPTTFYAAIAAAILLVILITMLVRRRRAAGGEVAKPKSSAKLSRAEKKAGKQDEKQAQKDAKEAE